MILIRCQRSFEPVISGSGGVNAGMAATGKCLSYRRPAGKRRSASHFLVEV